MLLIESALLLIAFIIALVRPTLGQSWFQEVEQRLGKVARQQWLAVVVTGITALSLRLALLPILPIPKPMINDEFGYLLQADTFVHGHLTNPPHPMWVHFETLAVIQQPTYQSFGQPGQGLLLALGKVVFGHPFWGVWLSTGIMCAAIAWMLQGWMSPEWALVGGLLAVLRFGTFSYWANSYWGGSLGAIGGALMLGALPRLKNSQRVRDAFLMAFGLAILANTRPYEGLLFSLPVAVSLFAWIFGHKSPRLKESFQRIVMPLSLLLVFAAIGTGYYFWRVTGSPFRMPYQVEREAYGASPYLLWERPKPMPAFRHSDLESIASKGLVRFNMTRTKLGFLYSAAEKAYSTWSFYLGPAPTLVLLMLFVVLPYGITIKDMGGPGRFMSIMILTLSASVLSGLYFSPHYASPGTAVILFLILAAMRRLRTWQWREASTGLFFQRAVVVICFSTFLIRATASPLHLSLNQNKTAGWYEQTPSNPARDAIVSQLEHQPGPQLVIVRYGLQHAPDSDWVQNSADIDSSRIVWARDMGPDKNQELIHYFSARHVWLLESDKDPVRLSEYPITE